MRSSRRLALTLLLLLLLAAARASAQVCSPSINGGVPFTGAYIAAPAVEKDDFPQQLDPGGTSIAAIDAIIDAAPNGSVICLRRGQYWPHDRGIALTLTTPHSVGNEVTICASDDTGCTDSTASGWNPIIYTTGMRDSRCVTAIAGAAPPGYLLKNIRCWKGNFNIRSDSPLIGSGTPTGAPPEDARGATRPDPPSIGAYEYVTGGLNTTPPIRYDMQPAGGVFCPPTSNCNPAAVTTAEISLHTDEPAVCRYSANAGTAYASMTLFNNTGSLSHSATISGVTAGGSYTRYMRCMDADGNANTTDVAVSFSVAGGGPDTFPPVRSNGAPTGTLAQGTTQTTLSLNTDENATCRQTATPPASYASMPAGSFTTTGGTSHSVLITGLSDGLSYTRYVRCIDALGNANTNDYTIDFDVAGADTTPPVRSNGAPSGALAAGTTQTTLSLTTNEAATCRRSDSAGVAYASMPSGSFSTTGGTSHSTLLTGLTNGSSYTKYVRCIDASSNANTTDYPISFSVNNPGGTTLIAAWSMDAGSGTTIADTSGYNHTGTLSGPTWTPLGKYNNALLFDGTDDYVDVGNPSALNVTGSLTMSAWIYPTAFPGDDAAIVSKRGAPGPQLDTTVDTGPRTIGFKLTNSSGSSMIRYGATTLSVNTWHHVAGVYDADAQTMHVYLNGVLDDGSLSGTVTASQQTSALSLQIGQSPSSPGTFNHIGRIDEMRIYSGALNQAAIQNDMVTPIGSTTTTSSTSTTTTTTTTTTTSTSTTTTSSTTTTTSGGPTTTQPCCCN